MGSLVIVNLNEVIELLLLLQEIECGRFCRLFLQGQMHAFMAAVLLRASGFDALDIDAQAQPPYRQFREAEQSLCTGKGRAVIGANGSWQAELLENAFKNSKREFGFG